MNESATSFQFLSKAVLLVAKSPSLYIQPFHPLKSMPSFAKVTHNLFSFEDWATMPGPPMQSRFIFKSNALSYTISHCDDSTDVLMSNKILDFASCPIILTKIKKWLQKRRPMAWRIHKKAKYFNYFSANFHMFPAYQEAWQKKGKSLKGDIKLLTCGC